MLLRCTVLTALVAGTVSAVAQQPDKKPAELPLGKGIRIVAFSPDGALLAAGFGEPKERGRVRWRFRRTAGALP